MTYKTQRERLEEAVDGALNDPDVGALTDKLYERDVRAVNMNDLTLARNTLEGLLWEFGEDNPRLAFDIHEVINVILRIRG